MQLQVALLVKVELEKLLDVHFIRPIDYPEWISNLVPVAKLDCNNFRDMNKACPKDEFLFPNIYLIVYLIARHAMLSLIDELYRYN